MSDQWSKPLPCCADLPACVLIRSQSRTFVVLCAIIYFARPPLLWVCFTQVCLMGSLDLVFIDTQIRRISSSPLSGIFFTPLLSGAPFQSERWARLRVFSSPATHCAVPQSKAVREEKENRSNRPFFTLFRHKTPLPRPFGLFLRVQVPGVAQQQCDAMTRAVLNSRAGR